MRCRTAAILSVVLIGGMFGIPAAVMAIFLPSLEQGTPNPIPGYERLLLGIALFCMRFKWLLTVPILMVLFGTAGLTSIVRMYNRGNTQPQS